MPHAPFFFLLALLLVASPALAGTADLPEDDAWFRADGEGYVILSALGRTDTERIAVRVDRMLVAMEATAGIRPHSPAPVVFIFRNEAQYRSFREPLGARMPHESGALLVAHRDGAWIIVNGAAARDDVHLVCHEVAQYVIERDRLETPLWYSEGLAEVFSRNRSSPTDLIFGTRVSEYLAVARREQRIDLDAMFRVGRSSADYGGTGSVRFYALATLFTHYVMRRDGGRTGKLASLASLVHSGHAPDSVSRMVLTGPLDEVERDFRAYVKAPGFASFRAPLAETPAPRTRTATRQEVAAELGYFLVHIPSVVEPGRTLIADAVRSAPESARARSMLARADEHAGRVAEARRGYERAAEAAEPDPLSSLIRAEERLRRARADWEREIPASANAHAARELLISAVIENPDDWRGWSGLGETYFLIGDDPDAGRAMLESARDLAPASVEPLVKLALLRASNGEIAEADCLLQELSVEPSDATAAREALAALEVRLAHQAWREGRIGSVEGHLELALRRTANPDLARAVDYELQRARRQQTRSAIASAAAGSE